MRCSVLPLVVALLLLLPPVAMETQENDFKDGCQGAALLDGEHDCTWSCIIFTLQWPGGFCAVRSSALGVRVGVRASTGEDLRWFPSVCPVFVQRDPLQDPRRRHRLDHPRPVASTCAEMLQLLAHVPLRCPGAGGRAGGILAVLTDNQITLPVLVLNRKQEWSKHGACAACVEGFNSPQKYFQISLKLRQSFEIQRILEDAGITPSCERRYKVAEVQSVLTPHVGDQYEIQCVVDHRDRQVWFQVKIRMSRDLTLGCSHPDAGSGPGSEPSPGHPCPPEVPFFYFPINHQQPERPCD